MSNIRFEIFNPDSDKFWNYVGDMWNLLREVFPDWKEFTFNELMNMVDTCAIYLLYDDSKIFGIGMTDAILDSKIKVVCNVGILESYRKKGYGKFLLRKIRENSTGCLLLETKLEKSDFYRKCGATRVWNDNESEVYLL